MSSINSNLAKKSKRGFQTQKIFIQKIGFVSNQEIAALENRMIQYFSMYGRIIDKKVLENGQIIRF